MDTELEPLPIRMGGLMRCCTGTYEEQAPPASESKDGDVLPCRYCKSSMILRNGAWEWNRV
jgi:hypothetical protein